ncbi:MAG: FKBP-type peptidyl-prolyl cis-trans isomerase [Bacteroidales bacterium]|nr:FKBP-type peptidyl-prolyl cis-trans isomerase [Bacteroidales bacterium]
MRFRYTFTLILAAAMALASCTKESRELMYANQETRIESFVGKRQAENPDARVVHNGGATRVVESEGTGVELTARGKVTVMYAGYNFSSGSVGNSTLFATNSKDFASSAGWNLTDESVFVPLEIDLTDKDVLDGLRYGLEGVREGEECYILFSGKYAFGKSKIGTIPANAPLAFRIWVQKVEN